MLCLVQLAWGITHAQSTGYVYDANGRVVAVTASNGTSVQYTYNSLGHASQVSAPVPSGQLAIFAFMPTHGQSGTQVTIQGQGFDSNAANDTVNFNGAVATVLSASATQLVVAVPSGATTGLISVSAGNQTATSTTPFVVDDSGLPPTITQVSPALVSVGNTVTVLGAHLDPAAGEAIVRMAGSPMTVTSATDSQLQYVVPASATSGFVTVATPYGHATSSVPLIVLPSGLSAANVADSVYTDVGGSADIAIPASGKTGTLLFQGGVDDWISLQLKTINTTANAINYAVYAPGNQLIQQGAVSASAPSIHLPQLTVAGNYLVTFTPDTAAATFTVGVERAAVLGTGTPLTLAMAVQGQSKRLPFHGTAGQVMTLLASGTTTVPVGQSLSYTIYDPRQQIIVTGSIATNGSISTPVLSDSGVYQVIVSPGSGVTASTQIELVAGDMIVANWPISHHGGYPVGKSAQIAFTANQGDNLELTLSNVSFGSDDRFPMTVNVLDAHGTNIASGQCGQGGTCRFALWNLAQGSYSVVATPMYNFYSIAGFDAVLQSDTVGPALSLNTAQTATLALGQVERFTFNGNAGDNLALNIANVSTANGSQQPVTFAVYRPDTSPITTTNAYLTTSFTSSGTLNIPNLPISGTYTVIVSTSGVAATAQLTLTPTVIAANGQGAHYGGYLNGQSAGISFTANQDDNLELTLSNVSFGSDDRFPMTVNVLDANGTNIASGQCGQGGTCRFALWNLAQGSYSVVATPMYNFYSIAGFDAVLQPDTIGPALNLNTAQTVTLSQGQVERFAFNGNAGDNLALDIANVSTANGTQQPVTFAVYRPDASPITTTNAYLTTSFTSSGTLNIPNLPISGTYTVIVSTSGVAATAQLTLTPTVIAANGQGAHYGGYLNGQSAGISFTANQGDNLELTLSNVSFGSDDRFPMTVNVLDAHGTNIASGQCGQGGTCRFALWNLMQGSYSVVATPMYNFYSIAGFDAVLQSDTVGSALSLNTAQTATLAQGQVERFTFNGNAGDNLALNIANVSTANGTQQPVTFAVYRPGTSPITTTNTYLATSFTSGGVLNIPNLPISGTYTVIVSTSGVAATAQLTLTPTTIASNGQSAHYGGYLNGQSAGISFAANQGDNLELTLSNVSFGSDDRFPMTVKVLDANGTTVASGQCGQGGTCRFALWNLAQGSYSMVATPMYTFYSIAGFDAVLQSDTAGPALSVNTEQTATLAQGQVERFTFNGNAGDNRVLNVAGVSTTSPAGQPVTFAVYRPDNSITPSNAYMSSQYTDSGSLSMSNLPVSGTYTVVVSTAGEPGSAQLTLQ
ncbi:hypothetical protein BOC47_00665 [Burkholderia pseudomallei]|nr:hypothetical protein BOC47_00665 [Burkholderia pseudomallei]